MDAVLCCPSVNRDIGGGLTEGMRYMLIRDEVKLDSEPLDDSMALPPDRDHLAERHKEAQESLSAAEARAAEAEGRASSSLAALAVLNERYRAASQKAKALGKRALHLQEVLKEQVRGAGGQGTGLLLRVDWWRDALMSRQKSFI